MHSNCCTSSYIVHQQQRDSDIDVLPIYDRDCFIDEINDEQNCFERSSNNQSKIILNSPFNNSIKINILNTVLKNATFPLNTTIYHFNTSASNDLKNQHHQKTTIANPSQHQPP
ncbi:hypothetical protein ACLMJK_005652 [Lecanora helva]